MQIRDGYLILCGRVCKVSQEVIYANLSTNGVQEGQLVTVIDLSNAENPIKFEVRLPKGELIQEDITQAERFTNWKLQHIQQMNYP